VRVGAHGYAEGARQAEVRELELVAGALYKQVLGLEVAVQHPGAVGE
jgi:hypothetical protein